MLTLPLPIFTFILSVVVCVLVWRLDLGNRLARGLFVSAFVLMSIGTLLIAIRFGYGVESFVLVQRIVPLFIGPLLAFGFAAFVWPAPVVMRWVFGHLILVFVFVALMQVFPDFHTAYDVMIGLTYVGAIVALGVMWRLGQDRMVFAPLDLCRNIHRWMLVAVIALLVMLIFETGIAISFALARMDQAVTLVSYGSVFLIASLIAGIVVFASKGKTVAQPRSERVEAESQAIALEQKAREILKQTQLYLDTDLTLERLARRLHVPARALSEAINQTQAMNVSQYVNGFRLAHAADMLIETDQSVTRVLERSGFMTRSNFYREFERVYKQSPIEYRKGRTRHDT